MIFQRHSRVDLQWWQPANSAPMGASQPGLDCVCPFGLHIRSYLPPPATDPPLRLSLPCSSLCHRAQDRDCWRLVLQVKIKLRKVLSISDFSMSSVTRFRFPFPLSSESTLSLVFHLLLLYQQKSFLAFADMARFNSGEFWLSQPNVHFRQAKTFSRKNLGKIW